MGNSQKRINNSNLIDVACIGTIVWNWFQYSVFKTGETRNLKDKFVRILEYRMSRDSSSGQDTLNNNHSR